MTDICFFQYFHNGDLFSSKEYIRQIVQETDCFNFKYYHFNHEKVLRDLKIPPAGDPSFLGKNGKSMPVTFYKDGSLFINTWIEAPVRNRLPLNIEKIHGINHYRLRAYWKYIFDMLNSIYKTNLILKPVEEYVADIDFSCFNVADIDLKPTTKKRVLVSNGEVKSNQSFAGTMDNLVVLLALKFPNCEFYCTHKFITTHSNIFFTDDILPTEKEDLRLSLVSWARTKCDLNEISYFSQSCDIIIGRNSGPFIFCLTKKNVFDPTKTFISFNKFQDDSLLRGVNHSCKYIWSNNYDKNNMVNLVSSFID
jgi:hypothetical protein